MARKLSMVAFLAVALILPGTAFGQTSIAIVMPGGVVMATGIIELHRKAVDIGATRTAVGGIAFIEAVGGREGSSRADERFGEHGQI